MKVEAIARDITEELRQLGPGSRQGHRPTAQDDFGVYAADLRSVVKTFKKSLAEQSAKFVYQLAIVLLDRNIKECRQIAYELIAGHREARESMNVSRIESLGAGIDNWACVDHFCCTLVGAAWRDGRISDATIRRWSRSEDLWWRRAAVVATVPLNVRARGGTGDTVRTLAVCRSLLSDREVMVQKAISWALRELVEWDREAVERFMETEDALLASRVRREVSRKLTIGKKNL